MVLVGWTDGCDKVGGVGISGGVKGRSGSGTVGKGGGGQGEGGIDGAMTPLSSSSRAPDWVGREAADEDETGVSSTLSTSRSQMSLAFSFPFADAAGESL